eukprot:COSAG02_NODE_314_length_24915_cov_18.575596_9_plen_67_part_00
MQPREDVPLAASWPCPAGTRGGKLFRLDPRDYTRAHELRNRECIQQQCVSFVCYVPMPPKHTYLPS